MANLKSGIILQDGEKLVMELEAELWATSSNPIAQIIGKIKKTIFKFLGYKISSFMVITDRRVVEVATTIVLWCVPTGKHVKYVLPSSVMEVGYTRTATCGYFCPMYVLYYQGHTQLTNIVLKGVDEAGAQKAADAFFAAISVANK